MTTPRKNIPEDAKERAENVRDALMQINSQAQSMLEAAEDVSDGKVDVWAGIAKMIAKTGVIARLTAHGIREIEGIQGMDSPPDTDAIRLVNKRAN